MKQITLSAPLDQIQRVYLELQHLGYFMVIQDNTLTVRMK